MIFWPWPYIPGSSTCGNYLKCELKVSPRRISSRLLTQLFVGINNLGHLWRLLDQLGVVNFEGSSARSVTSGYRCSGETCSLCSATESQALVWQFQWECYLYSSYTESLCFVWCSLLLHSHLGQAFGLVSWWPSTFQCLGNQSSSSSALVNTKYFKEES